MRLSIFFKLFTTIFLFKLLINIIEFSDSNSEIKLKGTTIFSSYIVSIETSSVDIFRISPDMMSPFVRTNLSP